MIEFTVSRVMIFACAAILMVTVTGSVQGIYDMEEVRMDEELVSDLAHMLDVFQASDTDELVLDGPSILPEGSMIRVADGFVELHRGENKHIAMTSFTGEFKLEWNEAVRVTRRRYRLSCGRSR